jgi:hypothetical protein
VNQAPAVQPIAIPTELSRLMGHLREREGEREGESEREGEGAGTSTQMDRML